MCLSSNDALVRKLALMRLARTTGGVGVCLGGDLSRSGGRAEMRWHPVDSPALKLVRHELAPVVVLSIGLLTEVPWAQNREASPAASLSGAGATFPAPLYKKWIAIYKASHPNVTITY